MLNGYVMEDGYREYSPGDSRLWLELFILAERRSRDLCDKLQWLRKVGCILERNYRFGFVIRPVIGKNGWADTDEYNEEKQCLNRHRDELVAILQELAERQRERRS